MTTLNGTVTLAGEVNTPEQRARAIEIAGQVSGVRNLVSLLSLPGEPQPSGTSASVGRIPAPTDQTAGTSPAPNVPVSDEALLADIRTRLAADPQLSALDVDVQVEQGVVTLSGDVPDLSLRTRAERLARATRGVMEVRNELRLKR